MESQDKKDNRILKQRIEQLERENISLKKSLFEISTRLHHIIPLPTLLQESHFVDTTPTTLSLTSTLTGHQGAVYDVKWKEGRVASCSFDKTIRVWDDVCKVLMGHCLSVSCLAWKEDLVSGSYDQTCKVWYVYT